MLVVKRAGSDEYGTFIKMLLTGDSGAGKTRLSSTFPEPLYANAEGGLMSVVDRQPAYVDIGSSDDLLKLHQALSQPPSVRAQLLGTPVSTVIVDTIDVTQKILQQERLASEHKETMAIADWGWLGEQVRLIVRNFRNLDMNVVFTCHVKTVEDSDTGQTFVKPGLQGAMMDEIAAWVDLAVLLKAQPETRVVDGKSVRHLARIMQTSPDLRHPWLKDRSGKLPMEFEVNLTDDYARMAALIFPGVTMGASSVVMADVASAPTAPKAAAKAAPKATTPKPVAPKAVEPPVEPPAIPGGSDQDVPQNSNPPVAKEPVAPVEVPSPTAGQADTPAPVVEQVLTAPEVPSPPAAASVPILPSLGKPAPEPVDDKMNCSECGIKVDSADQRDLSQIRYRRVYCGPCYRARKATKK